VLCRSGALACETGRHRQELRPERRTGTPLFLPREQIINFKYVKSALDVWSMGAMIG